MKPMLGLLATCAMCASLSLPVAAQPTYYAAPTCYDSQGNAITCNVHMQYFGGPVMSNPVSIYNIWYGASASSTVNALSGLFSNLTGSAYLNIDALYGATTTINFGGNIFESAYLGQSLSDVQLGQIVNDAIGHGYAPSSNDAIYYVMTAPGIGEQSDQVACAFHSDVNGLKFAWVGTLFMDPNQGCGTGTFDQNVTSAASHEMFEALTDPLVAEATANGPPLGWYDGGPTNQGEVGDMCNQSSFDATLGGNQYTVQSIFVNSPSGGYCASGNPTTTTTPEPATSGLLATGLLGLLAIRRRRAV